MSIYENEEFLKYKEEIEAMPGYTLPSVVEKDVWDNLSIPPKVFSMEKAMMHPFSFAYHVVGIKPRVYQYKMMEAFMRNSKVVCTTGRQSGKSTTIALFSLWAALCNAYPSGPYKNTKIIIVSHTEDAAKKILKEITAMMTLADERVAQFTRNMPNQEKNYFRSRVKRQTVNEIVFANAEIKAYPPTDIIRGNSADILIIDEAAKLRVNGDTPEYIYNEVAEPTTFATGGKIILTSTPGGISGFFYDRMNPNETAAADGWTRIWYPWTVVDIENLVEDTWNKRNLFLKLGDDIRFKNEYEATFNSGLYSWIGPDLIDAMVDDSLMMESSFSLPVYVGLDFGDTHSRTVAVFVHPYVDENKNKKVKVLYHKEFAAGYNNGNLVQWFNHMKKYYNIKKIVADDCVGGKVAIQQLKDAGFVIQGFQFSKSKEEGYELLKNAILTEQIKMYPASDITGQFKALVAKELPSGRITIRKPAGGRDDICDAFMMAMYPHIQIKQRGKIKVWT